MLIDELLPDFDVCDRYHIDIDAGQEAVWQALWTSNLCESPIVSWLFWLRGLPSSKLTLSDIDELKFKILAEQKEKEVVFGIIGEFWTPNGNLLDYDPDDFKEFDTTGFAKCAWSFSLEPSDSGTRLTTETRVQVLGKTSRGHFDLYWAIVRPFSGWTRKEMLATVKRECESAGERVSG